MILEIHLWTSVEPRISQEEEGRRMRRTGSFEKVRDQSVDWQISIESDAKHLEVVQYLGKTYERHQRQYQSFPEEKVWTY